MPALLPGYEHQIVSGAGLSVGAGRPKVVLHTTETARGSTDPLIRHWRNNPGTGLPHFIVEGSRVVQLLPLGVGAYTLENAPGGADTNRSGPAVQAEIVSYAADDWDDATYTAVGRLLADIKAAGHDFDLATHPRWYGANEGIVLASTRSPIRMTAQQYEAFNGWCAHQHVPENSHWDCGRKNTARLELVAQTWLLAGGKAIPVEPPFAVPITHYTEDDDMPTPVYKMSDGSLYACDGASCTWLLGDMARILRYPADRPAIEPEGKERELNRDDSVLFLAAYAGSFNVPADAATKYAAANPA